MKEIFWDIRGLGKKSRTQCVAEMIMKWELEFIGLQETKTKDFPIGSVFSWEEAILGSGFLP
jgi:hypothetical protein